MGSPSALGYTRAANFSLMTTNVTHPTDAPGAPRARTIAFVFPGQGSQYVGMGADLIERSPAAAAAFERADQALGIPLSRMILEGPAEELDQTVNAQPAILATSVAYLDAMREEARQAGIDLVPMAVAGHSAGQYAAAVAANALDYTDALHLVRERGRIMQEKGIAGGMGAVIGLSDEQVHEVVEQAREHGEISVANANAPGQIVLSGVIPALVFALEMSKTVGARKAVRLTVSVASHSPLMRRARDEFGRILARVPFRDPQIPMLGNVHASFIDTADGLRLELREHLVHGVQWTATVRRMAGSGVTDFVEVGPGRVLSGLIRRISPEAVTHQLDGVNPAAWLQSLRENPA
jgi:[acyl-carrier-protein] S-malonyltransferase